MPAWAVPGAPAQQPGRARQVRDLGDERKRAVVGISPESRDAADGRFLDGAIVGIGGTGEAIAAGNASRAAAGKVSEKFRPT